MVLCFQFFLPINLIVDEDLYFYKKQLIIGFLI